MHVKNENNELGKSEMWVVLWAKPGAEIIYGLVDKITPDALRRAIRSWKPRETFEQSADKNRRSCVCACRHAARNYGRDRSG